MVIETSLTPDFCKDKMKYSLAIFAGGLGSRLLNTEDCPKPIVDINGLSLLSRIILSFQKTGIFKDFYILTCFDSKLFESILFKELRNKNPTTTINEMYLMDCNNFFFEIFDNNKYEILDIISAPITARD